ncbi:MAG: outer membrane protein [Planctomycetota bacterium]|jgi:outer membrane protein
MKKMILALSIVMSLVFVNNVNAQQKFGHVNTQVLFEKMPEVAALQGELTRKSKEYQTRIQTFYTQYQNLATDIQNNGPTYSQMVVEQKYKDAAALEQKITSLETEAQKELANYEQSRLAPIEKKAFDAITIVANANGYTYVFDGSLGVLIVKPDADDITNLVKMELGI